MTEKDILKQIKSGKGCNNVECYGDRCPLRCDFCKGGTSAEVIKLATEVYDEKYGDDDTGVLLVDGKYSNIPSNIGIGGGQASILDGKVRYDKPTVDLTKPNQYRCLGRFEFSNKSKFPTSRVGDLIAISKIDGRLIYTSFDVLSHEVVNYYYCRPIN